MPCKLSRCLTASVMLLAGCALAFACRAEPMRSTDEAYQPFYPLAGTLDARGSLKGDYQWAASSPSRREALVRWREFLTKYRPPNDEYEDAFQRNYVRAAQYELMRVEYLLGDVRAGDALLHDLEDV